MYVCINRMVGLLLLYMQHFWLVRSIDGESQSTIAVFSFASTKLDSSAFSTLLPTHVLWRMDTGTPE